MCIRDSAEYMGYKQDQYLPHWFYISFKVYRTWREQTFGPRRLIKRTPLHLPKLKESLESPCESTCSAKYQQPLSTPTIYPLCHQASSTSVSPLNRLRGSKKKYLHKTLSLIDRSGSNASLGADDSLVIKKENYEKKLGRLLEENRPLEDKELQKTIKAIYEIKHEQRKRRSSRFQGSESQGPSNRGSFLNSSMVSRALSIDSRHNREDLSPNPPVKSSFARSAVRENSSGRDRWDSSGFSMLRGRTLNSEHRGSGGFVLSELPLSKPLTPSEPERNRQGAQGEDSLERGLNTMNDNSSSPSRNPLKNLLKGRASHFAPPGEFSLAAAIIKVEEREGISSKNSVRTPAFVAHSSVKEGESDGGYNNNDIHEIEGETKKPDNFVAKLGLTRKSTIIKEGSLLESIAEGSGSIDRNDVEGESVAANPLSGLIGKLRARPPALAIAKRDSQKETDREKEREKVEVANEPAVKEPAKTSKNDEAPPSPTKQFDDRRKSTFSALKPKTKKEGGSALGGFLEKLREANSKMTEEEKGERGTGAGDAKKEIMSPTKIKLHDTLVHAESNIIEFDGELSKEKKEKLKQLLYLFLNEAEYNRQARIYCIMTICVIITDIILLVVESDPNYDLPSIRASYNAFTILLFGPEMIARIAVHNAFTETWKEFLAKGYNFVDLIALFVQSVEVAFFLLGEHIHPLIKFLRVTSALRIIRIFKLSTFGRGVPIMIQGLRESSQALGILLFFTLICLVLISTLLYFVENIIYDIDSFENHGSFAQPTAQTGQLHQI
eukprot:TRINITY_DN4438_c0_g1_i6.p1 TRINITY_DN4438_c0_g1~~TRINITY_DN4438_c0_g1_i6.p1  ORF type:complete len:780 (+),score=67.29 TRINITY_DN4438_c0_g1_i6:93-2432(+)